MSHSNFTDQVINTLLFMEILNQHLFRLIPFGLSMILPCKENTIIGIAKSFIIDSLFKINRFCILCIVVCNAEYLLILTSRKTKADYQNRR